MAPYGIKQWKILYIRFDLFQFPPQEPVQTSELLTGTAASSVEPPSSAVPSASSKVEPAPSSVVSPSSASYAKAPPSSKVEPASSSMASALSPVALEASSVKPEAMHYETIAVQNGWEKAINTHPWMMSQVMFFC